MHELHEAAGLNQEMKRKKWLEIDMQWDEKQSRRESSILPTRKWTEKEETFLVCMH